MKKKFFNTMVFKIIIISIIFVSILVRFLYDYRTSVCFMNNLEWPYSSINFCKIKKMPYSPINIAIVDTGIDLSKQCFKGVNIKTYDLNAKDSDNNHGTQIAGIICSGSFLQPIKKNIVIHSIDIGTDNDIRINKLIDGIKLATDLKVDVINLSLGTYKNDDRLKDAVNEAINKGIVIVCAAGNDNTKQPLYPASYEGVVSVISVDKSNEFFINNNFNNKIIVSAPGEDIPTGIFDNAKKNLILMSGSSASTALITSIVSVLKVTSPGLNSYDVIEIFKNTCTDLGDKGKDSRFGYGLVNYRNAFMYNKNHFLYYINSII